MKTTYRVQNGTAQADFPLAVIEDMKMLGLIKFRGSQTFRNERRYIYTAANDTRKPIR